MAEHHQNKFKICLKAPVGWIDGQRYLEVQVGVLSSRDLVLVHIGVARLHGCRAVEWSVQSPGYLPVLAVVEDFVQHDACDSENA